MYQVKLTGKAKKELKRIKKAYKALVNSAIEELREDPFIGKPLVRELTGKFTLRIDFYRIVYKVDKKDKIVTILTAGHRSTIYE